MSPARSASAAAASLLLATCAARGPYDREVDPEDAIPVEVLDDRLVVDGSPVPSDSLREAVAVAHARRGRAGRVAAVVVVALRSKPGESDPDFQRRANLRKQEALDQLADAGVRDFVLGAESRPQ
jgi:hypothetical protein